MKQTPFMFKLFIADYQTFFSSESIQIHFIYKRPLSFSCFDSAHSCHVNEIPLPKK